jgi:hypothetical protein
MHPLWGAHIFFFSWRKVGCWDFCCSQCVPHEILTLFPPSCQWVPNMFPIACLSSTLVTYVSNSPNEEITTYLSTFGTSLIYLFFCDRPIQFLKTRGSIKLKVRTRTKGFLLKSRTKQTSVETHA